MPEYDDEAANEMFASASAQVPVGPPRRRAASGLTEHVPVRFSAQVIESVKAIAANDGQSVSSWIRWVVEREIARRQQPETRADYTIEFFVTEQMSPPATQTTASAETRHQPA